jgi:predicted DNA-binding transcriptional regulator AlpA
VFTGGDLMRMLSYADLKTIKGIPWSRQYINKLVKLGKFPKPAYLGPQTTAFFENEVDEHLANLPRERNKAGAA